MFLKKIALSSLVAISIIPALSLADITARNDSDSFATVNAPFSPCSSIAGDKGIMKPKSQMIAPQSLIDTFCNLKPCEVNVYLSKNCSGKKVAMVTVAKRSGVTKIINYGIGNYAITGSGDQATLSGGKSKGLFDWLLGYVS